MINQSINPCLRGVEEPISKECLKSNSFFTLKVLLHEFSRVWCNASEKHSECETPLWKRRSESPGQYFRPLAETEPMEKHAAMTS